MSGQQRRHSIVPGIVLILAGVFLLLEKLDVLNVGWDMLFPALLVFLGILFAVRGFTDGNRRMVFPAVFFILLGLFFGLRSAADFWWLDWADSWPLMLVIVGLAFFAQYLVQTRDTSLLVISVLLLIIGGSVFARNLGYYLPFRYRWWLRQYWPLLLILLGLFLVLSGLRSREDKTRESAAPHGEAEE